MDTSPLSHLPPRPRGSYLRAIRRRTPAFITLAVVSFMLVAETFVFALRPGDPSRGLPKVRYTAFEWVFGLQPGSASAYCISSSLGQSVFLVPFFGSFAQPSAASSLSASAA